MVFTLESQGVSRLVEKKLYLMARQKDFTYQICMYLEEHYGEYKFYPLLTMYLRPVEFGIAGQIKRVEYNDYLKEMQQNIIEEELQQMQKNRIISLTDNQVRTYVYKNVLFGE